jgi:hypothetical protein
MPKRKPKPVIPTSALPPDDTVQLRAMLAEFLDQKVDDPITSRKKRLGSYKFGVYAFSDYDGEPIYVGQTAESLGTRIRRHLTNQRSDAAAMNVLDPFEVFNIEVWPLPQYEGRKTKDPEARGHINWLEYDIFQERLALSSFKAVLNEKDPVEVPQNGFTRPGSVVGKIVNASVLELRQHPDTRLARRAETLALLAKVISERQVQKGLRRALLTQARRIAWLAERRLGELAGVPDPPEDD